LKISNTINNTSNKLKNISHFSINENITDLNLKEDNENLMSYKNDLLNSNGKDFINKKRKNLPKIYQNILDKNIINKQSFDNV
jgi:hypothetical protein